jgi:hypothetical protein
MRKEREEFDNMLSGSVSMGSVGAAEKLMEIRDLTLEEVRSRIKKSKLFRQRLLTGESEQQIRAAGCQILSGAENKANQKVFDGLVTLSTPMPKGFCDCKTVSKQWDPDAYQIRGVPIVYLNGENDPNTSFEWSKSQYDGQTSASAKAFLKSKGGGHMESYVGSVRTCVGSIFDSLLSGDISDIQSQGESMTSKGCKAVAPMNAPAKVSPKVFH